MADINYNVPYSYPRQKLPRSEKNKEWGQLNIDYIIGLSSMNTFSHSTGNKYSKMAVNYDLYNGIINDKDFKYVTNPYGLKEEFPARFENFNIITPKLRLLEGEEIKRPFNYRFIAVNGEAVTQIEEKKKGMLLQYLESELQQALIDQGINIQNPETGEVMTPEEVQKYSTYSYSDMRELTANRLADYLIKKENLEYKFNRGWKDALICAHELYYVGIASGEPIVEVINPLDFDYDKNPDIEFVQEGQWAIHTKYCTPSEVIDQFYEELTEADIESLDSGQLYGQANSKLPEGPASGPIIPISYTRPTFDNNNNRNGYVRVARVEWKSMRKVGFLTYYDPETQEELETIVDETYKAVKYKGEKVEWVWINEVWEGTKIGNNIYVKVKPKTVQYRTMDNPSTCRLGFVGAVYNARNSEATSLIDMVKHHQYLYNVLMYRMELEIAKAKGKKMVMDIAQIPRSQGIDMEKWMYYFDTLGLAFINSFEEGKGKFAGQTSSFNQFANIDMTLSQSIGQYINIMAKIENMVAELMGVSPQRLGAISSSETVGGVERSVQQSSHITESLFYMHSEVKKCVLEQIVECAKFAYPEGKKISYILDDMNRVFLNMDEGFIDSDYAIFMTNGTKENQTMEYLKSLVNQSFSAGLISLKEAVSIFKSNSMSEIENTMEQAQALKQQEASQTQQDTMQQIQATKQAEFEHEMALQDRLDQREVIKGDIQKEIKAIEALSFNEDKDINANGVPDVFEYEKLASEMKKHNDEVKLKTVDQELENKKIESDAETKKYVADKQAQAARANKSKQ